jgi:hypothetical protein
MHPHMRITLVTVPVCLSMSVPAGCAPHEPCGEVDGSWTRLSWEGNRLGVVRWIRCRGGRHIFAAEATGQPHDIDELALLVT